MMLYLSLRQLITLKYHCLVLLCQCSANKACLALICKAQQFFLE